MRTGNGWSTVANEEQPEEARPPRRTRPEGTPSQPRAQRGQPSRAQVKEGDPPPEKRVGESDPNKRLHDDNVEEVEYSQPRGDRLDGARGGSRIGSAAVAARVAATAVAELTGHQPETVTSLEPCDDGWSVGVEVVETHRIPDSADILATYEVRLDANGELRSYRRLRRYSRGQLQVEGR
jgi:hypothetical protein